VSPQPRPHTHTVALIRPLIGWRVLLASSSRVFSPPRITQFELMQFGQEQKINVKWHFESKEFSMRYKLPWGATTTTLVATLAKGAWFVVVVDVLTLWVVVGGKAIALHHWRLHATFVERFFHLMEFTVCKYTLHIYNIHTPQKLSRVCGKILFELRNQALITNLVCSLW